mmetsp:Transcript_10784/g.25716  ORF Transcript_10784/g.25716 Transcript_10784/m.25716 type:complete len:217 (-) Transcript_10784:5136-5786(-)
MISMREDLVPAWLAAVTSRVKACRYTNSVDALEQVSDKVRLDQRFASTDGDSTSTRLQPFAVLFKKPSDLAGTHCEFRMLLGISQGLSFGVAAEDTSLGTALQEDSSPHTWTVSCTEGLEGIDTAKFRTEVVPFHVVNVGLGFLLFFLKPFSTVHFIVPVVTLGHSRDRRCMHRSSHHFLALFRGQTVEPDGVSRHTNRQVGVFFWMNMCITQDVR